MNGPTFSGRLARHLFMILAAAAAGALDWAAWFGWDQHPDRHPDGSTTGPYEPWQVIGFALVAVLVVAAVAWARHALAAVAGVTSGLTLAVSLDWSDDASGLWVVGAGLICVGAFAASSVLAALIVVGRHARETAGRGHHLA